MAAGPRAPHGAARWQKATALLPLALLVGAWAASLSSPTIAAADFGDDPKVPAVPTTTFDSPASYTDPSSLDPSLLSNPHDSISAADALTAAASGIPTAAMLAYQRAETVLAEADPACRISWALIAAIGRVESDHGRYAGNVLTSNGIAKPGIYGIPLDGSNGTALIKDTDNGAYDNDPVYDRAVGPMQFIPSTWAIVGVDGDGDGIRDPQDIDDAALAAAVYLCAGDLDLSTAAGQRTAVFSYNNSHAYVDLVLAIMRAYLDGDYMTVADGLPSTSYLRPISGATQISTTHSRKPGSAMSPGSTKPGVTKRGNGTRSGSSGHQQQSGKNTRPGSDEPPPSSKQRRSSDDPPPTNGPRTDEPPPGGITPGPTPPGPTPPGPTPPGPTPTVPLPPGPTPPGPTPTDPTPPGPTPPGPTPTVPLPPGPTPPGPSPTVPGPTPTVPPVVDPVVKATNVCQAAFEEADYNPTPAEMDQCVAAYQEGGKAAVDALIAALTAAPPPVTPPVPPPPVPTPPLPTLSAPTPSVGLPTP